MTPMQRTLDLLGLRRTPDSRPIFGDTPFLVVVTVVVVSLLVAKGLTLLF